MIKKGQLYCPTPERLTSLQAQIKELAEDKKRREQEQREAKRRAEEEKREAARRKEQERLDVIAKQKEENLKRRAEAESKRKADADAMKKAAEAKRTKDESQSIPQSSTMTVPSTHGIGRDTAASKIASILPDKATSAGLPQWSGISSSHPQTFGKDSAIGYGYCTDYVKSVFKSATGTNLPFSGDAGTWYNQAMKTKGFLTVPASDISIVPSGAIAVWSNGGYGHVAIVKSNNGKNSITFAEVNWGKVDTVGKSDEAIKFLKQEAITSRFNMVDLNAIPYAAVRERSDGAYKLLGFIIPE